MANAAPGRFFPEVIYGHKGTIAFESGRIAVYPEPAVMKGEPKIFEIERGDTSVAHRLNFLDSVRSRKPPVFNGDLGYQVMVAIKLGVDSYREGRIKHWDPAGDRELTSPSKRPGYEGDGRNDGAERRRS
jgi:hypothetical protein